MSWIRDSTFSWYHHIFARILKCGEIPKHVAFIMDGNRRFAKKIKVEKFEGHNKGFDKLSEILKWCLDLRIYEVTVYAFSIENFKRSKEEVDGLMNLAREKFKRILSEKERINENGIRVKIVGDIDLLPDDLKKVIQEVEEMTENNSKAFLNVAFAYTAQDEMTKGVNKLLMQLNNKTLNEKDVCLNDLSKCMFNPASRPPDIIIRTSGETRLSDFLLFQGCFSYIEFTNALWPELTPWDLLWILFKYQHAIRTLGSIKNKILDENYTLSGPGASKIMSVG